MREIIIDNFNENQRLDKYILKYLNKAPKSFVYKMVRKKNIKLNGKKVHGSEILKNKDILNIYLSDNTIDSLKEAVKIEKKNIQFGVIYEDNNILVCNKPIGLLSQPDNKNKNNSLNDQALYYLYNKGDYKVDFKPSICNRLDRNTSGIVVVGKNLPYTQALNIAFKNNDLDKYYITAVNGKINEFGTIKLYHIKDEKTNKVKLYDNYISGSKEIITEYKPLKIKNNYTLLEIKLITGKSHQIRASLQKIGYPILGDIKYGSKDVNKEVYEKFKLKSQFLHCSKIIFRQKETVLEQYYNKEFLSEIDENFRKIYDFFND